MRHHMARKAEACPPTQLLLYWLVFRAVSPALHISAPLTSPCRHWACGPSTSPSTAGSSGGIGTTDIPGIGLRQGGEARSPLSSSSKQQRTQHYSRRDQFQTSCCSTRALCFFFSRGGTLTAVRYCFTVNLVGKCRVKRERATDGFL